ncbi:unnamed protein product [Tilletia controversa]|uniref:Uncharacterized protein n=3 Tax=Tilletia TaxID=13289 RepID=A0A8X7MXL9_9BASI|nr:hypothetical protein CF336_g2691 [Tilletia laevis]KAE8200207.1 hypothetical protein CF328_g3032 [Tilletia controversa]KAE8262325.1 hypothetical protein A4X03_0g2542 [Tilletia caries]KAE8205046.1 hypothetical protein CF335_g2445 [Tilletia laevis]KAE8252190.1 hypothetical protein A4X06_0g2368 [Tilletia controversa]
MTTPAPSTSGPGAGPGASSSAAVVAANTTAKSANATASGDGPDSGPGGAAAAGEDLPGGPIWAELGSKMLQHSGGRPPNPKVNYRRKWSKGLGRWEEVTQEQVECKKNLASAVAKQIKLQDEVNYLIDMIGAVQSGSVPPHASSLLAQRPPAQHQYEDPRQREAEEYIHR